MHIYTIYMATNLVNGKKYIGFDSAWPRRRGDHLSNAFNETNQNKYYFHSAIKKYGKSNFEWIVLYQSLDRKHTLNTMERQFITEYRTYSGFSDCNGYNLTLGGDGVFGRIKSTEERGKPNKRSRAVVTPYGTYDSITRASVDNDLSIGLIRKRVSSPFFHDWHYVDAPKILKDRSLRTNSRSRQICTPFGAFAGIEIAAKMTGVRTKTISFKLNSRYQLDWYYTDSPKAFTEHTTKLSREIMTPFGKFNSVEIASRHTELHKSTINRRLSSPNYPDWYYVMEKNES